MHVLLDEGGPQTEDHYRRRGTQEVVRGPEQAAAGLRSAQRVRGQPRLPRAAGQGRGRVQGRRTGGDVAVRGSVPAGKIADDELFGRAMLVASHVLHALIYLLNLLHHRDTIFDTAHTYYGCHHTPHACQTLNFITRMLYKDKY